MRFAELERAVDARNPVAFSAILKKLTRDGLVLRTVLSLGPPAHVEYSLTALGRDFAATASQTIGWVDRHAFEIEEARRRHREMATMAVTTDG
jgi:DNA-binding HxlR family transcriptional regulator